MIERVEAWVTEFVEPTFALRDRVSARQSSEEQVRQTIRFRRQRAYRRDVGAMLDLIEELERQKLAQLRHEEGGAGGSRNCWCLAPSSPFCSGSWSVIANLEQIAAVLPTHSAPAITRSVDELAEMVREAFHGADRVKHIVRDLKTFSRVDPERPVPVDVRAVLQASINIASTQVLANEAQLGQIVLNLLVNAAQAIPKGDPSKEQIRVATSQHPACVHCAAPLPRQASPSSPTWPGWS